MWSGSTATRRWVSRWLYSGLHSLNFPWLYNNRPLWDIVVITFMLGGTALCVTSLVLSWRVLGQTLRRARALARVSVTMWGALGVDGGSHPESSRPRTR